MIKVDDELLKHWNTILLYEGLDAIQPQKPSIKEQKDQQKSKKRGLPEWAHWNETFGKKQRWGNKPRYKGSRKSK